MAKTLFVFALIFIVTFYSLTECRPSEVGGIQAISTEPTQSQNNECPSPPPCECATTVSTTPEIDSEESDENEETGTPPPGVQNRGKGGKSGKGGKGGKRKHEHDPQNCPLPSCDC